MKLFKENRLQSLTLPFFTALLLILSFPSFNLEFTAWVAFVPLFAALEGQSGIGALKTGFVTGLLFFLGLVYWVVHSMTLYGGLPLLIGLVVLVFFAAYLALYFALFAFILSRFPARLTVLKWVSVPFIWTSLELVRTHFLTGFPWGAMGYSQFKALPLIQIADMSGVYGVSFLLLLVNVSLYLWIDWYCSKNSEKNVVLTHSIITFVCVGSAVLYGFDRIKKDRETAGIPLRAALIQGNIDQGEKWNPAFKEATLQIYSDLSRQIIMEEPDIIIWPESSLPFFFQRRGKDRDRVINVARDTGAYLLFGSPAVKAAAGDAKSLLSFNRAFMLNPNGKISGYYDKIHLVPFGEYVPLKQFFPFIDKMVVGIGDFSAGNDYTVFDHPKGRFSTLICYEMIFPDLVRRFVRDGADFLVNITNDAWFGKTAAPYQHISMITFRAVENRVPVLRAANTGVTGIIDSVGAIVRASDIFTRTAVVGEIKLFKHGKTLYTRYGDLFAYLCALYSLAVLVYVRWLFRGLQQI